jgi:hypothetical protein
MAMGNFSRALAAQHGLHTGMAVQDIAYKGMVYKMDAM